MKKSISLFLAGIIFLLTAGFAKAAPFFIEGAVEVPLGCEITDTAGSLHVFPKEDSLSGFLGICALPAAKDAGLIESFSFIDFGFGLFLDSINGVKTSEDWDLSWSLRRNGEMADVGLADLVIAEGDLISLIYTSFSSGEEFDKFILKITPSLQPVVQHSSSYVVAKNPNVEKAVQFLVSKQRDDGLIENQMFTDWAALAFSSHTLISDPDHPALVSLKNYLIENTDPGVSLGSPVLSFSRRAMALMALGINPYSGTAINYIQKIVDAFDGEQIGDSNLVNDDIFALLVLRKAGFEISDRIIEKTAEFIVSRQKPDGSWPGEVDMTSAAIQALVLVSDLKGVQEALLKAKLYLQSQQLADGGFGSSDATSWAMQAIIALKEDWRYWKKNGQAPGDYLLRLQKPDGSINSPNPVWSTSYTVPAASGRSWGMILNSFPKQESNIDTEKVQRISQELIQIKEQALVLEEKITFLALTESESRVLAKEKQEQEEVLLAEKEEVAAEEEQGLLISQNDGYTAGTLRAQIGAAASEILPYLIGGLIIIVAGSLLVISSSLAKLWKNPKNK